jgi:TRAP transporter TAXI family solute receptor
MAARLSLAALAAIGLVACGGSAPRGGTTRLSIATGNTGGVYYPYGGGYAKAIGDALPGVEATAEVTSASVDNLKLLHGQRVDVAFALADTLDDAVKGRGAFDTTGGVQARTLAVLYSNYTQVVTIAGRGIARLGDLEGKVVSTGSPGSGTEVIALRMLRAAGLDPDRDVRRQGLSVNASVDAIKDGKLDAFFWSGGLPTGSVLDLASTMGVTAVLVPNDEVLPALRVAHGPLYSRLVVPAAAYPGLPADVPVVGVANVLVVSAAMSEQLAYDLTRVLFEKHDDLAAIHPEAARLTLASAVQESPAPFHPGAIRFYKERGVWTR